MPKCAFVNADKKQQHNCLGGHLSTLTGEMLRHYQVSSQ